MFKKALKWPGKRRAPGSEIGGSQLPIRGEKVILRDKRTDDTPDDYAWRKDEDLARLDATRPINMSYEEYLRYAVDELELGGKWSHRLAIDTLDGKHIGNCMYYDIDSKRRQAELGIMIGDREYWERGYGTDSINTLLCHIFTTSPLERIYLHTLDWNHRARRSFARRGIRRAQARPAQRARVRADGHLTGRMGATAEARLVVGRSRPDVRGEDGGPDGPVARGPFLSPRLQPRGPVR